jgi:hypothetical protein
MLIIDENGITFFDYKISYELLILIGIVYLILVGYTVYTCYNTPRFMDAIKNIISKMINTQK